MPRRVMKALRGGETESLTQIYWTLKAVTLNKRSTAEELAELRVNVIPKLNDDELAYAYWELRYAQVYQRDIKENVKLVKEYLLTEWMDRKYKRGAYKDGGIENTDWA